MFLLMALAALLLVPSTPLLQSIAPLTDTGLLLVPALAACAWLGWSGGGRAWIVAVWTSIAAALIIFSVAGHRTYVALECGWVLILVAAFGLVSAASPAGTRFLARALTALTATVALSGALALLTPGAVLSVARVAISDAGSRPNSALDWVRETAATQEWKDWTARVADGPALGAAERALETVLTTLPADTVRFYPALLALESLAALALAWTFYNRLSRAKVGPDLGHFVDFRFNDQLVWGVVAGLLLSLLPAGRSWGDLGLNFLCFFGALYAIRGLAIAVWFLTLVKVPGPLLMLLAVAAGLLSAPAAAFLALVGLSDTWLDIRSRRRASLKLTG